MALMADQILPAWMMELKARKELEQAQATANIQKKLAAQKSIEVGAPGFFKQLIKELYIAVNGCETLALRGLLITNKKDRNEEQRWSISISALPPVARQACTDLFYATGDLSIRCLPSPGEPFNLEFVADDSGTVFVISKLHPRPLNPEKAAQSLLEPMLEAVGV
jgi:hypothetical protein